MLRFLARRSLAHVVPRVLSRSWARTPGDEARREVQHQHDDDQYEGGGPRPVDEGLAGHARRGVGVEGEDRQRGHPPANGLKLTPVVSPTMISSGAVSPMTRAIASVMPGAMPAIEVGMTTFMIVRHFGVPSA